MMTLANGGLALMYNAAGILLSAEHKHTQTHTGIVGLFALKRIPKGAVFAIYCELLRDPWLFWKEAREMSHARRTGDGTISSSAILSVSMFISCSIFPQV
jgi:hypothetical protein